MRFSIHVFINGKSGLFLSETLTFTLLDAKLVYLNIFISTCVRLK